MSISNKWPFLLAIPLLRFLVNFNHYWYLRTVLKRHDIFIDGIVEDKPEKVKNSSRKARNWIQENQIEIKKRVLNTGLNDQMESYMEPLGLGFAQKQQVGALDNLLLLNTDILKSARQLIERAEGYYKTQAFLSLSPLFWIEMIVFLPREMFKLAGFNSSAKSFQILEKTIQIFYWVISIIYTIKLLNRI